MRLVVADARWFARYRGGRGGFSFPATKGAILFATPNAESLKKMISVVREGGRSGLLVQAVPGDDGIAGYIVVFA